jgi:hypothetical protein
MLPPVRVIVLALLGVLVAGSVSAQAYPSPEGYPVPNVGGIPVSPRKAALLRVLDDDLERLAEQGGGRVLNGTLELVVGSAFVGLSFAIDDALFRSLLLLTGGISLGRGVNTLALSPDTEQAFMQFRSMSMATPADVEARLRFGDATLADLARRSRAARIVDGTLTMVGSAAYVPMYWGFSRAEQPSYRFGDDAIDYVGLAFSAIGFASGMVTVFIKSSAERRNKAYREYKRELFSLRPSVGPGRAGLSLDARF